MTDEHVEGRKYLTDGLYVRWWVLVTAQVYDDPCHITQEGYRYVRLDEGQERLYDAEIDDVVPQSWPIAYDVTCRYVAFVIKYKVTL